MVRIKAISRSETESTRDSKLEVRKMHKNVDPAEHPFERAKEVKRAVNAVKLDKMFAKPFLWSLEGHMDGVYSTATTPTNLSAFVSGSCDGELRVWDISHKKTLWDVYGHQGFVTGISVDGEGHTLVSCGDDKTIKQWPLVTDTSAYSRATAAAGDEEATKEPTPLAVWTKKTQLLGIDHHRYEPLFATASTDGTVDVWNSSRSEPYQTFTWGADTVKCVRFNPAQVSDLTEHKPFLPFTFYHFILAYHRETYLQVAVTIEQSAFTIRGLQRHSVKWYWGYVNDDNVTVEVIHI